MLVIGVIGGSVPFVLFFSGLAIASAPTAAFIHKTLFIWVVLLAVPFLGERLGWFPIAALGVLLAGQFLAAPPTGVTWGTGETMILAATLLWAVEVVIARRLLLGSVPSPVLGAARLGIGLVVLIGYLGVTGRFSVVASLTATQWAWGLGTGALLAAYVGDLAGRAAAGTGDGRRQRPGPRRADHGRPQRGRQRHGPGGRRSWPARSSSRWPSARSPSWRFVRRSATRSSRSAHDRRSPSPARSASPAMPTAPTASATAAPTPPTSCSAKRPRAATCDGSASWRPGSRAPGRTSS